MTRYRAVHQFHSGTAPGDAITQNMLHLQEHLLSLGFASEVFAEHVDPRLGARIRSIHDYGGDPDELLLLHHSMGNDSFDDVISLSNDIVAVYHNITPERFFTHPHWVHHVRLGHHQLAALARRAQLGVAASNFNRREMLAVGFRRVEVLPPRTDFSTFSSLASSNPWRSSDWLFVGRIVANKCQHDLVRAFAAYSRAFDDSSRLVLIGDRSDEEYVSRVEEEAQRLEVSDRLVMLGKVSEHELRSALAGAGVFVCLSEHEGFGVPILEAMAAGLPVVGYAAAAVAETMAGAGILLRSKEPAVVAAAVQAVRSDAALSERLVQRQLRRVQQVSNFDTRGLLERVINRATGQPCPLEVQVQGPFESSYSLAATNRALAVGLSHVPGHSLSIFPTEGPGDYEPREEDLAGIPEAAALYKRAADVRYPDVVIRQMWPPRVIDSPGAITCEYFAWEESLVPPEMVDDFNRYLDGIAATSRFVEEALRRSGVHVPIRVIGNGVERPDPRGSISCPELEGLRSCRFLNIGSGFPRKGVDVLLEAFFAEFDGTDDVTLILKTFPNPHNGVGDLLARLRREHPNPPDVRWLDTDVTNGELAGLYNLATCVVHPARAEGFGLPVAEAMAARIPVISVAHSGLSEFVSEDTAVTIPFSTERTRTHLSVPGSTWAAPDRPALQSAMRALSESPDSPAIRKRVEAAAALINSRFSWEAATAQWVAFLQELEDGVETPSVAMVSTWNSRCGIAENTRYIVEHSRDRMQIEVLANSGVEILDPSEELGVIRCWVDRWHPDLSQLDAALAASDADVVHVQFNFGFFELDRLAALVESQRQHRGIVISLHRTQDIEIDGELVSLTSIAKTLRLADCLIVHQRHDAVRLAKLGVVDNVRVVPLGTAPPPPVEASEVRRALGLDDQPVVATFGFLLPHKGTLELLGVIDALRHEFPDIHLLALCARHPDPISVAFEDRVRSEIEDRHLDSHVSLVTSYLPDADARTILRAADVIVLPYRQTEESSSAALRFVLPAGPPIVATDLPIFADTKEYLQLVPQADSWELEEAIRQVLLDADLRGSLIERAAAAARRFSWEGIVSAHREVYVAARRAARGRRGDPRPRTDPGGPPGVR
ncbi:MAG: glycosyltransferase family 4 protein [Acidimicrobiales bacterium]